MLFRILLILLLLQYVVFAPVIIKFYLKKVIQTFRNASIIALFEFD